ncbi:MAG TPA: malto-oligosyltrehalose trehalohydrolase [Candidatus Xenobia bacterium]|jgi:maltooligosyltrehalose trehalohydrolase
MQGAWLTRDGVRFRVYAPQAQTVEVESGDRRFPLERSADGHFSGTVRDLKSGDLYRYRLNGDGSYPDPCSYSQPAGPHGPSGVPVVVADGVMGRVPPSKEVAWAGPETDNMVIYECHVGCMSPAGTFEGLISRLDDLVDLGVTAVQLMPVAEFPGRWNWGYDGVNWFAPSHCYGGPAGLRGLVDACHERGLSVILDVVYNHFGPDGNYIAQFNPAYFTERYHTPWGAAINLDGGDSGATRRLLAENALFWLEGFDIDGLRLDAAHRLYDSSDTHILERIAYVAHRMGNKLVIAEDDRNNTSVLERYGIDAVYADDFHHVLHVMLTGERDGYYEDYQGTVAELAATIQGGWLYQGQMSKHWGKPRGTVATNVPWHKFVYCLQNHDQVGNRALGERIHQLPGVTLSRYLAASALLLFLPATPLLFMGQEFAASSPFQYFSDHAGDLGRQVSEGRRREFGQFAAFAGGTVPDPQSEETFRRSRLRWEERAAEPHATVLRHYKKLLSLRRDWDTASLTAEAEGSSGLRVRATDGDRERLLVVQFGDAALGQLDASWQALWSSEDEKAAIYQR